MSTRLLICNSSFKQTPKNYPTLILLVLSCFILGFIKCKDVFIPNPKDKDMYEFNFDNNEYEDENYKLDFFDGDWFYFSEENILEFHPNKAGMYKFSITDKGDFIYLQSDIRVLVFPMKDDNANPYVAQTIYKGNEDNRIFNSETQEQEDLINTLNELKDKLFTENQLEGNFDNLNKIPYYSMKRSKMFTMLWPNKIGYFSSMPNDDTRFFDEYKVHLPNVLHEIGEGANLFFQMNLIANMLKVVFFKKIKYSFIYDMDPVDKMKYLRVHKGAMEAANSIIQNLQNNDKFLNALHFYTESMFEVALECVDTLMKDNSFVFFTYSFDKITKNISLSQHIENRVKLYDRPSVSNQILSFAQVTLRKTDLDSILKDKKKKYEGQFKNDLNIIADNFKIIANEVLNQLEENLPKLVPLNPETDFDAFLQSDSITDEEKQAADEVKNLELEAVTDGDSPADLFNEMINSDHVNMFFFSQLAQFFVPNVLGVTENLLLPHLHEFSIIKSMNMEFGNDDDGIEAFQTFVQMLKVVGIVGYYDEIDREMYKHTSENIFDVKGRLLIV